MFYLAVMECVRAVSFTFKHFVVCLYDMPLALSKANFPQRVIRYSLLKFPVSSPCSKVHTVAAYVLFFVLSSLPSFILIFPSITFYKAVPTLAMTNPVNLPSFY